MQKYLFVYVTVQRSYADRCLKVLPSGKLQRRRRRIPLPPVRFPVVLDTQHFPLQKIGIGPVRSDFQGTALGRLVVLMNLLSLVR